MSCTRPFCTTGAEYAQIIAVANNLNYIAVGRKEVRGSKASTEV